MSPTRVPNNATWTQLHTLNSAGMTIGDIDGDAQQRKDIIINFPGNGVYAWMNNTTWISLSSLLLACASMRFNSSSSASFW